MAKSNFAVGNFEVVKGENRKVYRKRIGESSSSSIAAISAIDLPAKAPSIRWLTS